MSELLRQPRLRKSIVTVLLIALALSSAFTWLQRGLLQHALGPLDRQAEAHIEATMTRAVYTFAAARGINALVSVIQGTAIAVSPAGVGVTLGVGEVLDPINDLIERFSWIMLVSSTSLGIQRVLLEMSDWIAIQGLLTVGLLVLAVSVWCRALGSVDLRRLARRLLIIALLIRFFIPAYALASEAIYARFLAPRYEKAAQSMDTLRQDLKTAAKVVARENDTHPSPGYLSDMRLFLQETRDFMDIRKQIDHLKNKSSRLTEYTISLIVVFCLQTILLPLAMLWLFTWFARRPRLLALPPANSHAGPLGANRRQPPRASAKAPKPPEIKL